ncbi:MAG: MFS transporter, partial [Paraburkholderia sp.]
MSAPIPTPALVPDETLPVDHAQRDSLYRRISLRIIPFLFICYIVSILDRSNIGFAQLQMRQD